MSNTVPTYKVVDKRGNDFEDVVMSPADVVYAFSVKTEGWGWRINNHPNMPTNNPVFTLVSMFDKDDNLIDKMAIDDDLVDTTEDFMVAIEERDNGSISYVVLTNEFDADEEVYFLGGY